ncbi:MAG: nucleotide exchange factor GrpE [Desulfamplus sp.]|nr:nucleotide exchange factor GrpE [Desulfamplus sp.]
MNFKLNELMDRVSMFMNRFVLFIKNIVKSIVLFFNEKIFKPIKNYSTKLIIYIKNFITDKNNFRLPNFFKGIGALSKNKEHLAEEEQQPPITEVEWKINALEDFKLWLSEIPSEQPPVTTATPDACDLYTMLSEFTALRQEIKMQNKEQNRTINALNSVKGVTDEYGQIYTLFKEKTNQIAQLEQNIRLNSEKRAASSFFDVRDSLVKGYRESVDMANRKGLFRRPPKDIHTICEGYEMAISRFDKSLSIMDIEPIQTNNVLFNPDTMKVVETKEIAGVDNGMVIETVSGGFVRGREVLRFAKVIVAQSSNS